MASASVFTPFKHTPAPVSDQAARDGRRSLGAAQLRVCEMADQQFRDTLQTGRGRRDRRAMFLCVRALTSDMSMGDKRPYFLWDEDISVDELREKLASDDVVERRRLLGKMLREARDIDVWLFATPEEVARELPFITRRLGRRARFWTWLIGGWRQDGLLAG